ncbi:MAG: polysaccharide biosynthesis/export family protein [Verrucomicrobiota bacterium]|nr:polysaccharide biosynthesis/export family protein [Verrucomicrobiota bacterium]MDE3068457.1 polysaccharide biosynthesis/export family protein [Verrucomicrobiota bacterium]
MKNLFVGNELAARLGAANCPALLLAMLLALTGCETNQPTVFSRPSAPGPAAQTSEPSHAEAILLREGDVVNVTFPGSSSLDTTQQIRRDGKVVLPLVGEVTAAGKTPEALQQELIKLYAPQVATKQVIVTVQSSTFPVFVTGAVLRPGKVLSDHPISALDAIMEAGGFDYTKANLKHVVVIRQEKDHTVRFTLNLKKVLQGSQQQSFYLKPSDIVYVPEKFSWF